MNKHTMFSDLEMWFGDACKDDVTGFKGIVTSVHGYIDGCVQIGLTPLIDKDGNQRDTSQFDKGRLTVLKKAKVKIVATPTGGPPGGGTSKSVR